MNGSCCLIIPINKRLGNERIQETGDRIQEPKACVVVMGGLSPGGGRGVGGR